MYISTVDLVNLLHMHSHPHHRCSQSSHPSSHSAHCHTSSTHPPRSHTSFHSSYPLSPSLSSSYSCSTSRTWPLPRADTRLCITVAPSPVGWEAVRSTSVEKGLWAHLSQGRRRTQIRITGIIGSFSDQFWVVLLSWDRLINYVLFMFSKVHTVQ